FTPHYGSYSIDSPPYPLNPTMSKLRTESPQRHRIHHDGNGAEAHRGAREDRIQDDLEAEQGARREDACRERDQRGVVEERPEEVLSDLLHRPAAQLDRGDDVTQIVLDQHDPAGLHRDVR